MVLLVKQVHLQKEVGSREWVNLSILQDGAVGHTCGSDKGGQCQEAQQGMRSNEQHCNCSRSITDTKTHDYEI